MPLLRHPAPHEIRHNLGVNYPAPPRLQTLNHYYINKEWMLSATARRIYRAAAILSLTLVPAAIWLLILQVDSGTSLPWFPAVRCLVLAGILGTAITYTAMEYFIFGFDDSSAWKKTLWFFIMLIPPFGVALYCLIVYSRSNVLKRYQATRKEELAKQKLTPDYPQSTLRG